MAKRHHVVITGTGRSGTTFLVELMTNLGLDTGFDAESIASKQYQEARAGLERDIRAEDNPYIIKSPRFCDYAASVVTNEEIVIDHMFIPMRDLNAAAESRRHVVKSNVEKLSLLQRIKHRFYPKSFPGGLWHTVSDKPGKQEELLLKQVYKLMLAVSDSDIPVTFMQYPRITRDAEYLYRKLNPVLNDLSYEDFVAAFDKTVQPELVHSFNANDQ